MRKLDHKTEHWQPPLAHYSKAIKLLAEKNVIIKINFPANFPEREPYHGSACSHDPFPLLSRSTLPSWTIFFFFGPEAAVFRCWRAGSLRKYNSSFFPIHFGRPSSRVAETKLFATRPSPTRHGILYVLYLIPSMHRFLFPLTIPMWLSKKWFHLFGNNYDVATCRQGLNIGLVIWLDSSQRVWPQ